MSEPQTADKPALDRRQFLAGSTASAVALMTIAGSAVIHTTEAWGLETKALKPEQMRTLIKMARDIFPHDQLADKFYAIACKSYDEKSVADPKLKALVDAGLKRLDDTARAAFKLPYASIGWEAQRVGILKKVADGGLFKKMRGDLVVSLYNQKDVWPLFGYEGESASKGGYIARGFDDIKWL
jgi:hypothetical protein